MTVSSYILIALVALLSVIICMSEDPCEAGHEACEKANAVDSDNCKGMDRKNVCDAFIAQCNKNLPNPITKDDCEAGAQACKNSDGNPGGICKIPCEDGGEVCIEAIPKPDEETVDKPTDLIKDTVSAVEKPVEKLNDTVSAVEKPVEKLVGNATDLVKDAVPDIDIIKILRLLLAEKSKSEHTNPAQGEKSTTEHKHCRRGRCHHACSSCKKD